VQATLVAAHAISATRCELEITPPLADPLARDSVVVYGNVALASHGESVTQILGAGDAGRAFQRFELKQLPLTYRAAANEIGAASELTVRVGDIAWSERSTMYGASPTEHAFTVATDERRRDFVVFGDGTRGARLPAGVNNVRATSRKGLGVDGNVASEKLTQLMSRPLGLKSVSNPLAAEGGTDPEAVDVARANIPLTTRTLGRAVSLLDYEDFARAFSGITKAQAQILFLAAGPAVAITLAGPKNTVLTQTSPVWINLLDALKKSGDPHVTVVLLAYQASTFRVGMRVKRDPAYESKTVLAAVEATLRAHYAFAPRMLGRPVQQSEIISVAQGVPGVVAIDVTRLYGGTQPAAQTAVGKQVRLLASRMRVQGGAAFPAELLTLDPGPLDQLEEMS
jgi:predicted phage baseplate assembly protein